MSHYLDFSQIEKKKKTFEVLLSEVSQNSFLEMNLEKKVEYSGADFPVCHSVWLGIKVMMLKAKDYVI